MEQSAVQNLCSSLQINFVIKLGVVKEEFLGGKKARELSMDCAFFETPCP